MKILLIEPAKPPLSIGGEDIFLYEPLALEYIAAGVITDHDVEILDMRLDKNLEEVLACFQPDVVGLTAYTVHVNTVRWLAEEIKARYPQILIVVGGHHATVLPADFLSPAIDVVVKGEGVFTFRQLIERYERRAGFADVPGLAINQGGDQLDNGSRSISNLDALPYPTRRLTAKYRKHYFSEWMKPLASIRTSKGCPFRCNFCAQWKLAEGKYLPRNPQTIVAELGQIEEPYVFFADDESLVDTIRMGKLAALIKTSGIHKQYFLYGRSDTIAQNPSLLAAWKEIGLERIFVGLEFFRNEDLDYVQKSCTTEDNERAIQILADLDLEMYASFIVRPDFTREDFSAFRRYCRELELSFASFAVLTPLPGTDLFADLKDRLLTKNYDFFDFIHTVLPTQLSMKDFYTEYSRLLWNAVPFNRSLAFLRRFAWREIPPIVPKTFRLWRRLRNIHKDYEDLANIRPVSIMNGADRLLTSSSRQPTGDDIIGPCTSPSEKS